MSDSSENIPCVAPVAANSTCSFESDSSTADRDSMEIECRQVEVRNDHSAPEKQQAYLRERKLHILKFYYDNGCNKYETCQKFGVCKRSLIQWIRHENEIQKGKKGSKRITGGGHRAFWPDMEEKLVQ